MIISNDAVHRSPENKDLAPNEVNIAASDLYRGPVAGAPKPVPKNFCILPFVSAQVRATGSLSVCCQNTDSARDDEHNEMYLYKHSLKEAVGSKYFSDLKDNFRKGQRPASCQRCFDDDDIGVRSRRKNENENHRHWIQKALWGQEPEQPVVFDLNLGTLCNLKCRTCGPASSSKWVQESLDLFGVDHMPRDSHELKAMPLEESRKLLMNWPEKNPEFYSTLAEWLPHAERVEFFGGEPMLSRQHIGLVRKSVESGHSKKQVLRYATNGTQISDELVHDLWPKFRELHLNVSVDGLEKQFEYLRYGAKWEELLANLEHYRRISKVAAVGINITVSIFNIYYLPEMFLFWEQRGLVLNRVELPQSFGRRLLEGLSLIPWKIKSRIRGQALRDMMVNENNYVRTPERFDVRGLPLELKEKVRIKFEEFRPKVHPSLRGELDSALAVMFSEDLSQYWPKFIESVWFHDQYRKQSFAEYFPEFYQEAVSAGVWYDYKTQPEFFFSPEKMIELGHPAAVGTSSTKA